MKLLINDTQISVFLYLTVYFVEYVKRFPVLHLSIVYLDVRYIESVGIFVL